MLPGKFANLLIVSDVDGTLAPEFNSLPQCNIEAARYFREQGGFFTIATGRPLSAAQAVIERFDIRGPVILLNGAAIYHTERQEYTYSECLPESAAEYIRCLAGSPHLLEARVMAENDEIYSVYRRPGSHGDPYLGESVRHLVKTLELDEAAKLRWRKVLFVTLVDETERFRAFADAQQFQDVDFIASSGFYYEMMPKGIHKGSGLLYVAEALGIPVKNTIAMGDYNNDTELLRAAGFAIAPGNAIPEIKAMADLIVCHCRDGALAKAVEYLETTVVGKLI